MEQFSSFEEQCDSKELQSHPLLERSGTAMTRDRVRSLGQKSFHSIRRMITMEDDLEETGANLVAEAMQLHKSDPKTLFFEIWSLVMILAMGTYTLGLMLLLILHYNY